ncbi:MAG: hypothetical protein ACE5FP_05530 [Gemmatimonadota bacterium]
MPQCHGNTKSGNRCKRLVSEGERFCGVHADQAAEDPAAEAAFECEAPCDRDALDALVAIAVGGVILGAALVFRRVFKVF